MDIRSALKWAEATLTESDSPALDAQVLLSHTIGKDKLFVLTNPDFDLNSNLESAYKDIIVDRSRGAPVAYLIGYREFWGREFIVTPNVLIPRPETEMLLEFALKHVKDGDKVLDLGTGSGCLAVSLVAEKNDLDLYAVDIPEGALSCAKNNAQRFGVEQQITFIHSNWFENLASHKFDLILSNPPYVDPATELAKDLDYEPKTALFSEEYGLKDIFYLIDNFAKYMNPAARVFCEFGAEQQDRIQAYLNQTPYKFSFYKDLAGLPRVFELSSSDYVIT